MSKVTLLGQCPDDGSADESRGTNDQNTHGLIAWFYIRLAMLKMEERCGLRRDVPSASRNERLGFEQGRLFYVK
jgi:hypothetical protein